MGRNRVCDARVRAAAFFPSVIARWQSVLSCIRLVRPAFNKIRALTVHGRVEIAHCLRPLYHTTLNALSWVNRQSHGRVLVSVLIQHPKTRCLRRIVAKIIRLNDLRGLHDKCAYRALWVLYHLAPYRQRHDFSHAVQSSITRAPAISARERSGLNALMIPSARIPLKVRVSESPRCCIGKVCACRVKNS